MASPAPSALIPAPAGVFPREHLLPNEAMIFETRPHFVAFVLPAALLVVVMSLLMLPVLFMAFGVGFRFDAFSLVWLGLFLVLGLLPLLAQALRHTQTAYAVTSRRILSSTGIVGRTVVQCSHDRIQNVTFHQGLLGRMTGSGNLMFATAGLGSGLIGNPFFGGGMPMLGGNVAFFAIPDPVGAKRVVDQVIEESRKASRAQELRELSAAVAVVGPTLRFCPFCGTARVPGASHCGQCGARLPV